MTPYDRRLQLLNAGYSPLPLSGKRPAFDNWTTRPLINADEIRLWANMWPGAANTGILCRLTPALDCDILDPEAAEAVEHLVKDRFGEHGRVLPRVGKPPKRAILFRTLRPFAKITTYLLAGNEPDGKRPDQRVEFLCDGQQIVVDGMHPDTRRPYDWPQGSIGAVRHIDLPLISEDEARSLVEDIVDLLTKEHGYRLVDARGKPIGDNGSSVKGNGPDPAGPAAWAAPADLIDHDVLTAHAMRLLKSGMHPGAAYNMLHTQISDLQGVDPERKQRRLDELRDIVSSARAKLDQLEVPQPQTPKTTGWSFHSVAESEATPWLIKGLLPETGAGLISGQWGTYKSTIALEIAVAVMALELFIGRFRVKRPGGVVYFAPEGNAGLSSRLTAIARALGVDGPLPFAHRADCPELLGPKAAEQLTAMAKEAAAELNKRFNIETVLVFVDTVVAAAGYKKSGDENDAALGQRLMATFSAVSRMTGALVLGIDHFGKEVETGTRGTSAKESHADVVLALLGKRELSGTITDTRLAIRKQREGDAGLELPFTPVAKEVGRDEDGDPITRVVIEWPQAAAGAATAKDKAKKSDDPWRKKGLRLLKKALMTVLADHGKEIKPRPNAAIRGVDIEVLRPEFYRGYPATEATDAKSKQAAKQKAFRRAVDDATAAKLIGTREIDDVTYVWLTDLTQQQPQEEMPA